MLIATSLKSLLSLKSLFSFFLFYRKNERKKICLVVFEEGVDSHGRLRSLGMTFIYPVIARLGTSRGNL